MGCDEPTCGDYSCAGATGSAYCAPFDLGCACTTDTMYINIPGVVLRPQDQITVNLIPAVGALPELPGTCSNGAARRKLASPVSTP